jgi:sugar phosphate permease
MGKITDRKRISLVISLLMAVYFISYLTRVNYNAVLAEITANGGFTKADASLPLTGLFITYGFGQLVSGYLGDRIQPKLIIFTGLLITTAMNLLIPFCSGVSITTAVWCVNGFAQAMIWPPLVKIMTAVFTPEDYKKACVRVSWSSSLGTIAVYLLAPVCISLSGWKSIFVVCGAFSTVMAFIWLFAYSKIEKQAGVSYDRKEAVSTPSANNRFTPAVIALMVTVMLAIVMQGLLRDGLTSWMPVYITDEFDISSKVSILTGVVLPVFSIISFQATSFLNRKVIRNEVTCAAAVYALGTVCAAVLYFIAYKQPALSVIMFALITGCMHGVNLILICMLPPYFERFGRVSFISGLFNSCTYVGSAASIYGVAVITERFGWHTTTGVWMVVAAIGTLLCIASFRSWRKHMAAD